jgi:glycosyltransferase involved in cell wall biosynthesis
MPEVAVIIPAYNQAAYICSTIETVQKQTFSDWELFIIDDGSTDNTTEAVREFLADKRIHYTKQQNKERAVARNEGIQQSSAPYIAFLDADDLWHPEKLAKQLGAMAAHRDAGLCYTLADPIDRDGKPLQKSGRSHTCSGNIFDPLLLSNFITNSSVLVRRATLMDVGLFDSQLPAFGSEDWDLWLRMARRTAVCLVNEELTFYRVHAENTSHNQVLKSGLAVVEKLYAGSERLPYTRITRSQARAHLYLIAARAPGTSMSRTDRVHLLKLAAQNDPLSIFTLSGAGAIARILLPSLTSRIKRYGWRIRHSLL